MAITFALQGCMAVGKTTAVRYAEARCPHIFASYESPLPMLAEAKRLGLQQNTLEGFVEIQRLFIADEIKRWKKSAVHDVALFDLGAEEIEFFTLFYPKSMGFDWPVDELLAPDLAALKKCFSEHLLFLDASPETLRKHKEGDPARARNSFEHYVTNMHPLKREWFLADRPQKPDVLWVDGLSPDEVGEAVVRWIERHLRPNDGV